MPNTLKSEPPKKPPEPPKKPESKPDVPIDERVEGPIGMLDDGTMNTVEHEDDFPEEIGEEDEKSEED